MLRHRVIPVLLISQGGLVKTTRFGRPTYVGDPINAVKILNEKEVDEVVLLDIDASRSGSEPSYRLIEEIAAEAFMPLAYGGGIRTQTQAARILSSGAEKISVQSGAFADPELIPTLARAFGSSSVIASVDVERTRLRGLRLRAAGSRSAGSDWLGWIRRLEALGAGEILLQAVERDGQMTGMDLDMVAQAAAAVSVPLVAAGGVGSLQDIRAGIDAGADAVAAGAFFVFRGRHRAVLISYPTYEELATVVGRKA